MDDVTFIPNPNLEPEVAKMIAEGDSPMAVATQLASVARSTAPVSTGDYAASIVAEKTKGGARVYSSDPNAAHIEFGVPSQGQPAHFTFRRAVDALGLDFLKKGKT